MDCRYYPHNASLAIKIWVARNLHNIASSAVIELVQPVCTRNACSWVTQVAAAYAAGSVTGSMSSTSGTSSMQGRLGSKTNSSSQIMPYWMKSGRSISTGYRSTWTPTSNTKSYYRNMVSNIPQRRRHLGIQTMNKRMRLKL